MRRVTTAIVSTVVYQSYRTRGVPLWIARCLRTVRRWAERRGHAYELVDDALFDEVPGWYRDKVDGDKVIMSDLGRLHHARRLLAEHQRVIWVDADIVVFDEDRFRTEVDESYAVCREAWLSRTVEGQLSFFSRVNNMVLVFDRGNPFLDFYQHACESIVRRAPGPVGRLDVGTRFLTVLHHAAPLPLLTSVALLSPLLMQDLTSGDGALTRLFMERVQEPLGAANLCASFRNTRVDGVVMEDRLFDAVVSRLVESRGEVLNGHLGGLGGEG